MSQADIENINDGLSHVVKVGVGLPDHKFNEKSRHNESIIKNRRIGSSPRTRFKRKLSQ